MANMYACDRCGQPGITKPKTVIIFGAEVRHGERDPNTVTMEHVCAGCAAIIVGTKKSEPTDGR